MTAVRAVPEFAPPTRPVLVQDPRLLSGWLHTGRRADLLEHHQRYGPLPLHLFADRTRLIDLVDQSGLTGRGGGWYPTGAKLRAVAGGRKKAIVLANGCEGEPVSEKDHLLLSVAPHLVLDGIVVAAHAVNAGEAIVCVHQGDESAATVAAAIADRPADPVSIRVVEVPTAYVASESSALVNFLNTGDARPTGKSPRPSERGVRGRPTLVDNVETLAHLALIVRRGAEWFRQVGMPEAPGTALMTITGVVSRPGVHELSLGATVSDALIAAGGPVAPPQAALIGGYGGSWVSLPGALGLRLDPASARTGGVPLGVAGMVVLGQNSCGLTETARVLRYLAEASARQCGPCMFGLPAIAEDMAQLGEGLLDRDGLNRLRRRLGVINGRGACAHPDGAVRLAASALRVFDRDARAHVHTGPCFRAMAGMRPQPRSLDETTIIR